MLQGTYDEIQPQVEFPPWASAASQAAELVVNGYLMKFPWFSTQRTTIERTLGHSLYEEALVYVLAHAAASSPDNPLVAVLDAARDMGQALRGEFDNSPFTSSLETDLPLVGQERPPSSSPVVELVAELAPDERGREIIFDIASGSSLRSAAANNDISPQNASKRMKRLRPGAKEVLNVI